jgi:UDP-GlcNAc:undecaprenyl-phosphate GlcNAc-1-phosphate transferase
MFGYVLPLVALGFAGCFALTLLARRVALRLDFVDKPGGRKAHARVTPLGGGVAIFWSVFGPLLLALFLVPALRVGGESLAAFRDGVVQQRPYVLMFIGAALVLHLVGLVDDRRALGPYSKLATQVGVTLALALCWRDLRLLTAAGPWASLMLTVIWIVAVTNAFNFLDNMDGLSAGIAAVASAAFLVTTLMIGQLFIACTLALLLGACLGFLCFNFSPASIFMGDSGSLVLGFVLGVLTVRTTFLPPGETLGQGWYTVFAPAIVLAVPLYDLSVVSVIRLSQGKSPFKGDTNHFSHRLVRRGMTKPGAVLCIYLVTAATAVAAIVLPHVKDSLAGILLFVQVLLILAVIYVLERGPNTIVWPEDSAGGGRAGGAS